jgi:hypothetical protein
VSKLSAASFMNIKYRKILLERLGISVFWLFVSVYLLKTWSDHTPDRDWDNASAHSYIGQALFRGWYQDDWLVAANGGTYLWPITDILLFLPRYFGFPQIGNLLITLIVVYGTIQILFGISKLVFKSQISRLQLHSAVALSVLSPYWLAEIGTTLSSWVSAPFVLAGLYFLLRYQNEGNRKGDLFLGGVTLGLSFALRLTNVIFILSSLILLLVFMVGNSSKRQQKIKTLFYFISGLFVGVIPIIPWWVFTFFSTGNPVFPYYNNIFKSSYYPLENFKDTRWEWSFPHSFLNIPTGWYAGTPVAELKSVDIRVTIVFVLYMTLFILYFHTKIFRNSLQNSVEERYINSKIPNPDFNKFHLFFHLWIITSTVLWIYLFGYVRYWITVEILIGIAIVHLICTLLRNYKFRNLAIGVVLALAVTTLNPPNWTAASSVAGIGTFEQPWNSELTREVSKVSGVLLVEGSPVAFLRETSPEVTNMINLDYPNTPEKFKEIARNALNRKSLSLVTTKGKGEITNLPNQISTWLGQSDKIEVNCRELNGPIPVTYHFCEVKSRIVGN